MPKTQINCPQCRQPILADIQQLFDVGENPQNKQIFLGGAFNVAMCQHCGFQGRLSTPLVYHDPEKELLLTFFPPEMHMTREEQEKLIGPLINSVVNRLPQEKRKGYLFNPRTMLTLQGMLETILEADGITKDMIKAQEERVNLIRRLLTASEETQEQIIQQEDERIDDDLFATLSQFITASLMSGDEESARQLGALEKRLVEQSTRGKVLKEEADEAEAAIQSLQELGDQITREKLLELVSQSSSDARLRVLAQLARPGMDYTFFQMFSDRIDHASGEERARLSEIRDKLLQILQEIDQEIQARVEAARQNVETLLQAEDVEAVLRQNINAVDEYFVQALSQALQEARKAGDLHRSSRLQQILDTIEKLSAPPPELSLIEELMNAAGDEEELNQILERNASMVTSEFLQMVQHLMVNVESAVEQATGETKKEQNDMLSLLQSVYDAAMSFTMRRNLQSG